MLRANLFLSVLSLLVLTAMASFARAEPNPQLDDAGFLRYLGHSYTAIKPTPEELAGIFGSLDASVRIYSENGELRLENRLAVNSKNVPAVYAITRHYCYEGDTKSGCRFQLELLNIGANVHFLGVRPMVYVDREANGLGKRPLDLEIQPDFVLAGKTRRAAVVVGR